MMHRRTSSPSQRGYSLAEMITVVAIVGIFSLIAVPQFMNMSRSMKMKASFRQFATDVRSARQRAITRNTQVVMTLSTGLNPSGTRRGQYEIWQREDNGSWTRVVTKTLTQETNDSIYFQSTTFENATDGTTNLGGDTRPDIRFQANGTVLNLPAPGTEATVVVKTDHPIAKHTYTLKFYVSGNFTSATN